MPHLCSIALCLVVAGCQFDTNGYSAADAGADLADATPPTALRADVTAVSVSGPGGAEPVKGDALTMTVTVQNLGTTPGRVTLSPRVTSDAFADFADVPAGAVEVALGAAATVEVDVIAGPFLVDGLRGKRYALGRGDLRVTAVHVDGVADDTFDGGAATIGASNAIFTAVVYDQAYLDRIGYAGGAEAYMRESFTRESHLFTPSGDDSDGNDGDGDGDGDFEEFAGGFDDMMNVRQHFHAVPGLSASSEAGGFCEQVGGYARIAFGLTRDWDVNEAAGGTDVDHHGFDMLVGLTPDMGGGAACGWLGVQVSGLFGFDLSLDHSQIIVVHETAHLFGSPHCDPRQGYVMCSGEKHERYEDDGIFVWHRVSRDAMVNRWR